MITDELRKWMNGNILSRKSEIDLSDIAYRIDMEHKKTTEMARTSGFDEGFAASDDWLAEHEDVMAEHGWVKLPVDADGVPIRVGDKMRVDGEPMCSKHRVFAIELHESLGAAIQLAGYGMSSLRPDCMHHHREQTVEEVLLKFYEDFVSIHGYGPDEEEVIGRYAKSLQIKEAGE